MNPRQIIIYCGLLLSISAFSVDILLPAFGAISQGLSADYELIQMTIPVFLAAIGVGQVFSGPLSDRFGRKLVLMSGLSLFAVGTLVCMIAQSGEVLLAGRAIQGLGASSGPVVARAVLRDLFSGRELASNLALATMVFAFGPIVAPLAGVAFMQFGTWRAIFLTILLFGLFLLAVGLLALPETIRKRDPKATSPARLAGNALAVLRHPQSRAYGLLVGPVTSLMMLILVTIPHVYKEAFGIEGPMFALLFAVHGVGIIVGQTLNRRLIARAGTEFALRMGGYMSLGSALLMAGLYLAGLLSAYTMSFTLILFAFGFLTMMANSMALSLDPHGPIAGFVSSFVESTGRVFAAVFSALASLVIGGSLDSFLLVFVIATATVLGLILLVQRRISA